MGGGGGVHLSFPIALETLELQLHSLGERAVNTNSDINKSRK